VLKKNVNEMHYFVFDREAENRDTFDTIVNLRYLGQSTNCDASNRLWPDNSSKGKFTNLEYKMANKITNFNDIVFVSALYAYEIPFYDRTDSNCQSFATGLYNAVTGSTSSVSNWPSKSEEVFFQKYLEKNRVEYEKKIFEVDQQNMIEEKKKLFLH